MIPIKDKTYKIDYWFQTDDPDEISTFYDGLGKYTGEIEDNDGDILYIFELPDNCLTAMFSEEDIVSEIKDKEKL